MIIASKKEAAAKGSTLQMAPAQAQQRTESMVIAARARIDDPPPYFPIQAVQSLRRPVPPVPPASSSTLDPRSKPANVATNFLFVKTRQDPVNGAFDIDPELQTVALDKAGATAIDRREYNRTHRQRHHHHIRKGFKKRTDLPDPNAIFETRQGAIQLDLSVVASPLAAYSRTLIQAATRQGHVDIKVHGIHPQRRLNMEVKTRNGDILILIPRSFSGYIQLYSRHGRLDFLPSLSSAMSLVARHEREVQVAVGDVVNRLPAKGTEWSGDTMHIASRNGDILIGYVGEDHKPTAETGFWKKLALVFQSSPAD